MGAAEECDNTQNIDENGVYVELLFDMVAERQCWFETVGSPALRRPLRVR